MYWFEHPQINWTCEMDYGCNHVEADDTIRYLAISSRVISCPHIQLAMIHEILLRNLVWMGSM